MKNFTILDLARQAVIAAIYVALVLIFHWISFAEIQFRIAELLLILVFFDKKSVIGLTVGVIVANFFSPMLLYDLVFGVSATVITLLLMLFLKKWPPIALLMPSLINGPIIGLMLHIALGLPFWLSSIQVFIGEFTVTYIIGLPLYYLLKKLNFQEIYLEQ